MKKLFGGIEFFYNCFMFVLLAVWLCIYSYFTRVKCPECGGKKFQWVTGPPRCVKCGWSNTERVPVKGKWYYFVD